MLFKRELNLSPFPSLGFKPQGVTDLSICLVDIVQSMVVLLFEVCGRFLVKPDAVEVTVNRCVTILFNSNQF